VRVMAAVPARSPPPPRGVQPGMNVNRQRPVGGSYSFFTRGRSWQRDSLARASAHSTAPALAGADAMTAASAPPSPL
jgi:hypothetical protein